MCGISRGRSPRAGILWLRSSRKFVSGQELNGALRVRSAVRMEGRSKLVEAGSKAALGVQGLDDITAGGLARGRSVPARRQSGHGQDHDRDAVPDGRRGGGRALALHHPVRNRGRAARRARRRTAGRSTGSTSSSWCRPKACSTTSSSRACFIPPTSSSAKPPSGSSRRSSRSSRPRRARQPVRDPPARPILAALSAADPGAEALFRAQRSDRADARRSVERGQRPHHAQRRPRRHPAGGTVARIWRRAAAAARRSNIAASAIAAATTTSSSRPAACGSSRGWCRPSTARSFKRDVLQTRIAGAQRPARRRGRARLEHAHPRARRAPASRCWR